MYDLPVVRPDIDAWWGGVRRHFQDTGMHDIPGHLSRPGEGFDFWLAPDLLFSQSCGYPLVTRLAGHVTLLGTPCYDVDGCEGSDYCSFIIVRAECPAKTVMDLRGRRCAVNLAESWSGHHALRLYLAPLVENNRPLFEVAQSGSHAASIEAVRSGMAEFAAVDCVVFGLLSRDEPQKTEALRILARTPAMPGLPLIAGTAASIDEVRCMKRALRRAFDDPALADARTSLRLRDFRFTTLTDYWRLSVVIKRLDERRIPTFL